MAHYVGNNPVNMIDPTGHCGVYPDGKTFTSDCGDWDKVLIGLMKDHKGEAGFDNLAHVIINEFKDQIDKYWSLADYGWDKTSYEFWVVQDRSSEFNDLLQANAVEAMKHAGDSEVAQMKWFASQVRTKHPWDLKNQPNWRRRHIIVFGQMYEARDLGNINFGYAGRALGLSPSTLFAGAGFYQVISGTSSLSFLPSGLDDPQDHQMIAQGMAWYSAEFERDR